MKSLKRITCHGLVATGLFYSLSAAAVSPHLPDLIGDGNRWTITFYDDSSPTHAQWATQGLCFYNAGVVGTQQRYIWVSDTYPDWNGRATQEGDQIFMFGDFQWPLGKPDVGHDGMEWEVVTRSPANDGAGHWKEWIEDGRYGITVGFGNAKFTRVGRCLHTTADQALEYGKTLQLRVGADGKLQTNPMGVDVKELQ
ncbi:MAG: hypothetical protein HY308_03085 [Gammaproteobacteria bacterium]|nr:hypothetical protein [Gammaproteobacteria bacterium]